MSNPQQEVERKEMMESIKNRERKSKRFAMCFRPVDAEGDCGGSFAKTVVAKKNRGGGTGERDPVLACNNNNAADSGGDNDKDSTMMVPVITSSDSDEVASGKRKRTKFSRIVKAVFFERSLAKKIRNKKSRKNSFRSSSNLSTNSEKSLPRVSSSDEDNEGNRRTNSNTSSARNSLTTSSTTTTTTTTTTLAPSRSSSITSISRSMSGRKSSLETTKRREDGWNHGLCLLLVSLLVLIFWGKVCAIFCTSTCLFFVPRRSVRHGSSAGIRLGYREVDSVEHKKRVVMEGFLGRNRTRIL